VTELAFASAFIWAIRFVAGNACGKFPLAKKLMGSGTVQYVHDVEFTLTAPNAMLAVLIEAGAVAVVSSINAADTVEQ
jgi:hypothetical protein